MALFSKRETPGEDEFARLRARMVADQLRGRGIKDERVLDVLGRIRRHRFVWDADLAEAYGDHPLRIGENQTISQPYMVALMTERLALSGAERVLEIGTGSGYQTAILAELAGEVWTIERHRSLSQGARARLKEMGYRNVHFRVGDGTLGWPQEAPFDRIIVAAGAPDVPPSLRGELAEGGRMVIPVGSRTHQEIVVADASGGKLRTRRECPCAFVGLMGKEGW